MYIPQHFGIKELVPEYVYDEYKSRGDNFLFQVVFDERLLRLIDEVREIFGPMTICDWSWGGQSNYRGFRPRYCDVGAVLSQHRFGRAVDMIPKDTSPGHMRKKIIDDQNSDRWKVVGGLEMDITWFHIDVRARTDDSEINLFYP
jgi:hypothetical protein